MAKTFVPSMVTDVHDLNVYLTRYGSTILAATALLNPTAVPLVEALIASVAALDALRGTLEVTSP